MILDMGERDDKPSWTPRARPFETGEEIDAYLGQPRIQCLLCGRRFKSLGGHLAQKHDMSPDDYRERFGIPWTRRLTCAETHERQSDVSRARYKSNPKIKQHFREQRRSGGGGKVRKRPVQPEERTRRRER